MPAVQGMINSLADFSGSMDQKRQEITEIWLRRLLAHEQVFKHPTMTIYVAFSLYNTGVMGFHSWLLSKLNSRMLKWVHSYRK